MIVEIQQFKQSLAQNAAAFRFCFGLGFVVFFNSNWSSFPQVYWGRLPCAALDKWCSPLLVFLEQGHGLGPTQFLQTRARAAAMAV